MMNYEYFPVLEEKLGKIKKEHKDVVDLINPLDCDEAHKNLFIVFLSNLKNIGVEDSTYEKATQMLTEKSNVKRAKSEHACLFGASSEEREVCTFDDMLSKFNEKGGSKFYESALEYATGELENNKETGNLIDYFLRYAVANSYDDIKHGTWNDANYAIKYYESTLYGYPLAKVILETIPSNGGREFFSPESLHVRKNLQGLRIGAFLLKEMMRDMSEKHPEEPLVSPTVMMSNVNALKLYTQLGADVFVNGEKVDDPISGMDHSIEENCLVVFSPEAIEKDGEMIIDKPTEKINEIMQYNKDVER